MRRKNSRRVRGSSPFLCLMNQRDYSFWASFNKDTIYGTLDLDLSMPLKGHILQFPLFSFYTPKFFSVFFFTKIISFQKICFLLADAHSWCDLAKIKHNVGKVIWDNFLIIGQKSAVGHLSLGLTCVWQKRSIPFYAKSMEGKVRSLSRSHLSPFLLSLVCYKATRLVWHPEVKPSDPPTFDTLQSCSLWYWLHSAKSWAKSDCGTFPHTSFRINVKSMYISTKS
jgi:hypothetical protein